MTVIVSLREPNLEITFALRNFLLFSNSNHKLVFEELNLKILTDYAKEGVKNNLRTILFTDRFPAIVYGVSLGVHSVLLRTQKNSHHPYKVTVSSSEEALKILKQYI